MKKILLVSLCLVLCVSLAASLVIAKDSAGRYSTYKPHRSVDDLTYMGDTNQLRAAAVADTVYLLDSSFDASPVCSDMGWTRVDITSQIKEFWHVADASQLNGGDFGGLNVINGTKSLWLGQIATAAPPYCGYATLPGYGNAWNQSFCTTACVATGLGAQVTFLASWDSEPGYDATALDVTDCGGGGFTDDGWVELYGGVGVWDGLSDDVDTFAIAIPDTLPGGSAAHGSVRVRFHFVADGAWSDQDGLWNTDGAFIVDDLAVTGLATEDFEGEAVDATSATDWSACSTPGYGDYSGLYPATTLVVEDPCASNITCVWGWFNGSTFNYGCGGFPLQAAVPYENLQGQYVNNEIWSPLIPNIGAGSQYELTFDVYRDLPLNALVFYVWHVRSWTAGCPSDWADNNFVFYGPNKDWLNIPYSVGDLLNPAASDIQVALGVVDMCPFWCGVYGNGDCHTHTPLIDNFQVYRINTTGPQWAGRDIDMFQDNFSADGTITGTARIDMAQDILPNASYALNPGDSAKVEVSDGISGLKEEAGKAAVYCWVNVDGPTEAAVDATPSLLSDDARWPVGGVTAYAGDNWYPVQLDTVKTGNGSVVENTFCVDLNDTLFVPGDTVYFFFEAFNTLDVATYWSAAAGNQTSWSFSADNADEVTILPAAGYVRGGDILYVDGMNFRGAQPYFDTAFQQLAIFDLVDRYDIRGPSSGVGNRPGSRVVDTFQQLLGAYKKIIWNTGDLTSGLVGDGAAPLGDGLEKSDDALVLNTFLDNLTDDIGGVYFSGDNIAQEWSTGSGTDPETVSLQAFITHNLTSGDHVGVHGFSPLVIGVGPNDANHPFFHAAPDNADSLIAYGGCAVINNFDVLEPTGTAFSQMQYGGAGVAQSAVIGQKTLNSAGSLAGVVLSGFSYHYIRDDKTSGVLDRSEHLRDILIYLGNLPPLPTPATPTYSTSLSQNYPNPFNPTTSIDFTVKELAPVSVKIYNVRGQLVKTLVNDRFAPGVTHQVSWDGRNDTGQAVSSGVYFYKLVTKNFTQTKKMVLLK